jgi:predicted PurR-regulated permease PerM
MDNMGTSRFYSVMLVFLLVLLGYFTYKIISPFLTAIAWAIVFSIVFYPVFAYISRYVRWKSLASVITLILILIVIVGPFTYVTMLLIDELKGIISDVNDGRIGFISDLFKGTYVKTLLEKVRSYTGVEYIPKEEVIVDNISRLGKGLIENLSIKFTNIITAFFNFVFMIFTIFFILKDGPGFLSKTKDYLPFNETQKDRLATQVKDMVVSTVFGGTLVAIIQGTLCGVAFYFAGISSPVIWGIALAVMSFVPFLGAFSIWGPHAGYLLLQGNYLEGVGLFLFGFFVISMVDNILKPLIIGTRTAMPVILIFFSVLGGIKLFGLIGLILGPLIMAVFLSVFEIFRNIEGGTNAES